MSTYEQQNFKVPVESSDYPEASDFVIKSIEGIIAKSIEEGNNKIILNPFHIPIIYPSSAINTCLQIKKS